MVRCGECGAALMAPQIPGSEKYITMKEGAPWSQATLDKVSGCGVGVCGSVQECVEVCRSV